MKKVITGHDDNGKAIFHQVEEQKANVSLPSVVWHEVWATHASDSLPIDMSESQSRDQYSDIHQVFPAQRQSLFRVLDFLPEPVEITPELGESLPGLMEKGSMETSNPGMHTTDSVDYGIIISGSITLELDDGQKVELNPGDVFVQSGTRHAWRVHEPCRMAVVLIGTERRQ